MDSSEVERRRRLKVEQYLANERLNETIIEENEPSEVDVDDVFNQPRQPHILERLTYCLVLVTLVLCVVNYSGPYLVYLKMAYGFHTDDVVFSPANHANVEDGEAEFQTVQKPDDTNVKHMDSSSFDTTESNPNNLFCDNIPDDHKFDCHPENNLTEEICRSRECCWKPVSSRKRPISDPNPFASQAPLDVPFCYYPKTYPGYSVKEVIDTEFEIRFILSRTSKSYYPRDITTLYMDVRFETQYRLHIKIYDPVNERYEVPLQTPTVTHRASKVDYQVTVPPPGEPFSIVIKRISTGTVLLKTTGSFLFTDQLIQLSYELPSSHIYGLGEHRDSFQHSINWTRFTLWTMDRKPKEGDNLYGDHPFYMMMELDGNSHGVFLLNSNAMDVIVQPAPALTWRTIGGIIDLYMFLGPSPDGVIQQYTDVIGRPFLPPYWSLGFHQCRWGYTTVNKTLAVVDRLKSYGIPQDVQWNDMDYARDLLDFTTGTATFGDQSAMVNELHQRGLHYVIIVDPAISSTQPPGSYPPYDIGIEMDVFIKDSEGKPILGKLWPGVTVWPDFTNPQTHKYWTNMVQSFHNTVQFDGMWIDMNEPVNFVTGSINSCPSPSAIEDPPYVPAIHGGSLRSNSLCATAQQYWGLHYNLHNLYGLTESNASYHALKSVRGKRPFVISRSTFPGQGHYGGHWNGDNNSTFYDMYKSISAILNMNLFGIPMVGSDICGFRGNATAALCQRWQQLGAFYPFARNHNNQNNRDQDPGSFGDSVAESSRKALEIRYQLLPYLYTLFYKSHLTGSTVARPLFFEYPQNPATYSIDRQFMWGSSLLISPVLEENTIYVDAYFPKGVWYNLHTGQPLPSAGQTINLPAPLDVINLHVKAGVILPTQQHALTTTESRKNRFELRGYLDSLGGAKGDLYWDDGDSTDSYERGLYSFIKFSASEGSLQTIAEKTGYPAIPNLGAVTMYGVKQQPTTVTFNGASKQFSFNNQILTVFNLSGDLLQPCVLTWR